MGRIWRRIYMFPQQVHRYLQNFFKETNCDILSDNEQYMTVQLTIEMDKKIMNRPFYWQYIESIGAEPSPRQVTFITDHNRLPKGVLGEVVHFGSPRLSQLFQATQELGAFVKMYERVENRETTPFLTPWLAVNYKVSYFSDQTKEMLFSLGINLMNGQILDGFQESFNNVNLITDKPNGVFLLQYIIKPYRALERLDRAIDTTIQQDDHTWAEEAKTRWQKDQQVLDYFYEGVEDKPECYEMEKKHLKNSTIRK